MPNPIDPIDVYVMMAGGLFALIVAGGLALIYLLTGTKDDNERPR